MGITSRNTATSWPPMPKQVGDSIQNVVVEQELHRSGSVICSITSASISVR